MNIIPESIHYHIGAVSPVYLMSLIAWAILFVFSFVVRLVLKTIPGRLQAFFETCFEMVFTIADEFVGPEARRYYPLFLGVFLFILVSNIMGLIPGMMSPTADLTTTVSLALTVFFYYNGVGFKRLGLNYILHFFGPAMPWYLFPVRILMFFIEVISHVARPFSLALRLFCNIFSKEMLLGLLAMLLVNFLLGDSVIEKGLAVAPLLLRPFIILLGLLIGFIQALIFLILTIAYVGGAVQAEEEAHA